MRKNTNKRAVSVNELLKTKLRCFNFEGCWQDSFGLPERRGTWIIWGKSGNGKTYFALQLAKYLASLGEQVVYNSLEQGISVSMQRAYGLIDMTSVARNLLLLDKEPIEELIARLSKHKSPNIIFIDSLQYAGLTYAEYKHLRQKFRAKLFIFISHADGSNPAGRVASSIRYDVDVKIWVEGYKAFPVSRYGGGEPYTIWEKE
jgi:hypothetical protein